MAYYSQYANNRSDKIDTLIAQLNTLSMKRYSYVYSDKHYIYYHLGNQRYMFRYASNVDELIKIVEILIRYRIIEYESEEQF